MGDRTYPELGEEEARVLCSSAARVLYRLGKVYGEARFLAYSTTSGEVKVSGGNEADPTADVALDARRAYLRHILPEVSAKAILAAVAARQALEAIQHADRLAGEQVGHTGAWTTETAGRAEERSTARRHARVRR